MHLYRSNNFWKAPWKSSCVGVVWIFRYYIKKCIVLFFLLIFFLSVFIGVLLLDWLPKQLRGCRYGTIEEMKEAVTKVIDTLTQEDFHGALPKLLERYKCIAAGGDYFEGD